MLRPHTLIIMCCATLSSLALQLHAQTDQTVEAWLRTSAVPIDMQAADLPALKNILRQRVIGLGEATHGQHEFFDLKRRITMQLIKDHQVRLIAYEASVSKLMAANNYISGKDPDRRAAVKALGMLIWQIEENAELMDSLRQWNQQATAADQVRLIGIDAQDLGAVTERLTAILKPDAPDLATRVTELVPRAQAALAQVMSGNKEQWPDMLKEIEQLKTSVLDHKSQSVSKFDVELCVHEFVHALTMYGSAGGRDRAMAELLMLQLDQAGSQAKCVIWAHNGHIQRSPLGYLGIEQLAMGGHLAKRLGDEYYAVGFAFGEGDFQANVQTDGKWGFRRYHLSPAPRGSLEHMLGQAGQTAFLIDLRHPPKSPAVEQWLATGHGQRWFGGYAVGDDCDERTQDATQLLPTTPKEDFDCLLYVNKTTAARPLAAANP